MVVGMCFRPLASGRENDEVDVGKSAVFVGEVMTVPSEGSG